MDRRKARPSAGEPRQQKARAPLPFPLGMDDPMDDMLNDDVDDADLEAELDALMNGREQARPARAAKQTASPAARAPQGGGPVAPPRRSGAKADSGASSSQAPPSRVMDFDLSAIERMGQDEDDDEEIDEDDPELLAELQELSPDVVEGSHPTFPPKAAPTTTSPSKSGILTLLEERLENYEGAHQDAVYEKDASKVRRYERSIKTIKDQIIQSKKGLPVAEDDVPPPVFIKSILQKSLSETKPFPSEPVNLSDRVLNEPPVPPVRVIPPIPAPSSPEKKSESELRAPTSVMSGTPSKENPVVKALKERRDLYKQAALKAKADNKAHSIRCMKIYKEFEIVIKAAEEGQEVDLSEMPPPPDQLPADFDAPSAGPSEPPKHPTTTLAPPSRSPQGSTGSRKSSVHAPSDDDSEIPEIDPSEVKATFKAPDNPKTVMEALQQRLEKYKSTFQEAKTAGDSSKARRMDRIVKQYQEAIKDFQAKKPVDFAELPTPPGFGPIPVGRPSVAPSHAPPGGHHVAPPPHQPPRPAAGSRPPPAPSGRESRHQQQYHLLVEREKQFKLAALKAKKEGAMETAKMYLRQANGLKPMIEASASGFPVDVASIPKPPPGMGNDTEDYEVVQYEDAGADRPATSLKSRTETYSQLEKDLVEQVAMCVRNVQHFRKCGDIAMSEKFEKFNQQARKDLDSLRSAFKHGLPVPRFHYETRAFSVVKHCPEIPETVMELSIIRGFGYTLAGFAPADFTTYVKWDFAFPTDALQSDKTMAFKGTNEPEYNTTFTIQINRKNRQCLRIFKKGIKIEVYVKMGFLKADKVLGSLTVCLDTLETKCVHHASIDLMEGKKAVGGRLEVRARLREPLLRAQVDVLQEKWLVIDQFVK